MAEKDKNDISQRLLYGAVSPASGIEQGKQILLENPIRGRKKYALEREREREQVFFPPEVEDFNINKGKSYVTLTSFRKPVFWGYLLWKQRLRVNRELFSPKVQFKK